MIHVKENIVDKLAVEIRLDGILDDEAVPLVADVCRNYLDRKEKVVLNLEGLLHINRAGRTFLSEMRGRLSIVNPPEFVELGQLLVKSE